MHALKFAVMVLMMLLGLAVLCHAEDSVSASGKLRCYGTLPLDPDSESESPSLIGRINFEALRSEWRFHAWIEGGWDGSVAHETRDQGVFMTFDEVYQRNAAFLEFKECYGVYAAGHVELAVGVQRFAWGRLDEYPINDLLNPWDYTQFLTKTLEDRKIGAPAVSGMMNHGDWSLQAVWIPLPVTYRLALPAERWSGIPGASDLSKIPGLELTASEPDFPDSVAGNGSVGLRLLHSGALDWALTLFHGYDPRPVFKTTVLTIHSFPGKLLVDPGYEPDPHKMSSMGCDAAAVLGDFGLRMEAAFSPGRYFNTRREFWGYPAFPFPGTYELKPNEHKSETLEYGMGIDYRLFEDCLLILQAQQAVLFDKPDTMYERKMETLAWVTLRTGWLNQKLETNFAIASNPEHGDCYAKASIAYGVADRWRAGIAAIFFEGDPPSLFGRFSKNDQLEAEIVFSW